MANPLDPLWQSYQAASDAMDVVERVANPATISSPVLLAGTQFAGRGATAITVAVSTARRDLNDQTVLFLYAAFEAALRDDLAARANLLATSGGPHVGFGADLSAWFAAVCDDARMDGVTRLFAPAAGPALNAVVGNVRKYRHWLAHGRRGLAPPVVTPQLTYSSLSGFLRACGMA